MALLVYLMGASGAGKDSVLDLLRQQTCPSALPATTTPLLVAHRYITRPAHAGGENHIALSEEEFLWRQQRTLFALHWQAHQQHYAVGIEIDLWLARGFNVIVNGSRTHLPQAQQRYGQQLFPLCLQVSPQVLRRRLQQRGRESAEQIEQRLLRAQQELPAACGTVTNDGILAETVQQIILLINRHSSPPISVTHSKAPV